MKKIVVVFAVFVLPLALCAQTEFKFTSGLVAESVHQYGRQALVQDEIAYQLTKGIFKKPEAGQTLFINEEGEAIQWQTIEADSSGRFRGRSLGDGYLYLEYSSDREQVAVLNISRNSMFYINGVPRGSDLYGDGWMYMPVRLKQGLNEILIRGSRFSRWQGIDAKMSFPEKLVYLIDEDLTMPHVVLDEKSGLLWGAIVVSNGTDKPLEGLSITSTIEGKKTVTALPVIPPMTIRKVGFQFDPVNVSEAQEYDCVVSLQQKKKSLDEVTISIDAVAPSSHQKHTFISSIDGSVQYYGVAPQKENRGAGQSLFLSVHGAGVEAIGQARAYKPKDWGTLVAPTNRRPRGFNWEDWGMKDGLEVLEIAKKKYSPDPNKIYLTGHSMGGHGTWILGATYPDKWAAIAPCAGYPILAEYGSSDGTIPTESQNQVEQLLLRTSNPSNVITLAENYKSHGIYIHHGDADRVVPVTYARQMREVLSKFHPDFSYYEYPGGSHWFGNESVDWDPLFDYFKWHSNKADSSVNTIDFMTANPGISASHRWISILQQQKPLEFSRVQLERDKAQNTINGTTENVYALKIQIDDLDQSKNIQVKLDGDSLSIDPGAQEVVYLYKNDQWEVGSELSKKQKGPHRGGTFKDGFNNQMVYVYATKGSAAENEWAYSKARFDAEVWYYRGNGSIDIVADKDFDPKKYADRGVVLYGNANTNTAWDKLLKDCPIRVGNGEVTLGKESFRGEDLSAYFVWPRPDSDIASVSVISGTGLTGMKSTEANQYFAGGSGFPDYMIFTSNMLKNGIEGVKAAGFFGNDWTLENGDQQIQSEL
ncbi:MAG: prolyl oligopeptidase family serine peptidase [Cyclobacteriaceae bacterium]|nr:prolyl oligopeptidase family serine peptidase [Cyclobacteriaceae bacterium SS2]